MSANKGPDNLPQCVPLWFKSFFTAPSDYDLFGQGEPTHYRYTRDLDEARERVIEAARQYRKLSSKLHPDPLIDALDALDALEETP